MNNNTPETCYTCDINYIEKQDGRECPHVESKDILPRCPFYKRASDETLKQNPGAFLGESEIMDKKHRARVGEPTSKNLRDLMARDLVHWLDNYDIRASLNLDRESNDEERLLSTLLVKPRCNADRLAAVLFSSALRGNVNAWNEVSKLLDRLDNREE